MAYNHGREERKWRIWKENEEKIVDKRTLQIVLLKLQGYSTKEIAPFAQFLEVCIKSLSTGFCFKFSENA